jgi:acetyl esterase
MTDYEQLKRDRMAALTDPVLIEYFSRLPGRPSLGELGVQGMRAVIPKSNPEALSDTAVSSEDVSVAGPHGPIPLRIIRPKNTSVAPLGIYFHTHGGGYVMLGGLDATTPGNIKIAKQNNCIVVGVDFRLPPEHPFPIPLDDCFAAFNWTAAHAKDLGGSADRIAIGGGCTGANFATATTILARDAGGPMPAAQYLFAPVFDLRCENKSFYENGVPGYSLSREDHLFVARQYAQNWNEDRFDWRASPVITPSLKGMPPTLIQVGEWDVLRDEAIQYADRLRDAGCDVAITVQPQQGHAAHPVSAPLMEKEMVAFLARTIGA